MRLIFAANMISMIGSGMNSAGVTWFLLQKTHSEMALGTLLMLQTIPALMMLPFTGVVIDREDRRRLLMILDAVRGLVILWVAVQAYRGVATLWEVYSMAIIVAAGFWMFWPTITALIQELTPDSQFVHSNSFLLAGVQGGWLVAGAFVGFVYNKIGLHGVLFIDFASYVLSFICYLFVRKGRHTVAVAAETMVHESAVAKFVHELKEGIAYIKLRPRLMLLGTAWALFIGGMLTQGVITAPFSDRILKRRMGHWSFHGSDLHAEAPAWRRTSSRCGYFHGTSGPLFDLIAVPGHAHPWCVRFLSFAHRGHYVSCVRGSLLPDGLLPRAGRRSHYQYNDGVGAQAFHGTRSEYVLLSGNAAATGVLFYRGYGCSHQRAGTRVCDCRWNLSAGMPGGFVAGTGCSSGGGRQLGARDLIRKLSAVIRRSLRPATNCCRRAVFA
jgi:hypothetical protein